MNLFERLAALKRRVPGCQEITRFEFTAPPGAAELHHIAPPPMWNRRILAELGFALQLVKYQKADGARQISAALDILERCMDREGVLTATACDEAEQALLPLSEAARAYEVLFVGHAHLDMNWMWGWQETVAITLATLRTVLNLMKEYPEFTFAQSQASVYRIVEEYDPDMMAEIKARIAEGRWEVTASAWVETDKNMPDTESLIRHIGYTRNYLHEVWGLPRDAVKVDFSPDTFGHSRFLPQIDGFGGIPYYYHCRGLQQDVALYRYRAPSGSELLVYREPYWYNAGVHPDSCLGAVEMEQRCNGLRTSVILYGVGDHGGGPTRRDIENILEMQSWPVFPTLKFGGLHEFFARAEAVREGLPIIDHELNAIFTGCYTTQSRIKLANRHAEAALLDSERMAALSYLALDAAFPSDRYEKAWREVLFTHFHDILTGSCVQDSREYAMGCLSRAMAVAQTEQAKACRALSEAVDTSMFPTEDGIMRSRSEGAGAGFGLSHYAGVPNPERGAGLTRVYTVFNPAPVDRRECVEVAVWDYAGDPERVCAVDHLGREARLQRLDDQPVAYWDHHCTRFLLEADVPAMGHAVYALRPRPVDDGSALFMQRDREELPQEAITLENEVLKAVFDTGSGMLCSLKDKRDDRELLGGPAGLYLVRTQDSDMSAWLIGRTLGIEPVTDTGKVTLKKGVLRDSVTFEQRVMHSTVRLTASLDAGSDALRYQLEVDWHETSRAQDWNPLLSFRVPLSYHADALMCDVPGGFVRRAPKEMDVPALTGVCATGHQPALALMTDCKYGYRLADDVLSATLIHTAGTPDPYPERGIHAMTLFVALAQAGPARLKRRAEALLRPMTAVPTSAHGGRLPSRHSFMELEAEHAVLTSMRVEDDGALAVRLFEAEGQRGRVTLCAPFEIHRACLTDLEGRALAPVQTEGRRVRFDIAPHQLIELRMVPRGIPEKQK